MGNPEGLALRKCKLVLRWSGDSLEVLKDVDVLIRNGKIERIAKADTVNISEKDYEIVNCSRYVVLPGLVNAHTHSPMVLLRGYCDDLELHEWLSRMWEVERHLDARIIELASELAIMEMLSTGTTAFVDMYFYPEVTAEVAKRMGIRAALGPPLIEVLYSADKCLREIEEFHRKYSNDELIIPIVNVHSIYTCSLDTVKAAAELAKKLNTNLHIHVSETRKEVFEAKRKYGKFPVEILHDLGVLNEHAHLVHLGWVTSREIELIRFSGATVTHCPVSNMKLATAGFFPFFEMIASGINVTIGTDGAASNNCLDMFREMKTAVLLQRNNYWDTRIKALHVLRAATLCGYRLLKLKGGNIEEGYLADLVLIDAESPYLQPLRMDNVLSNIVYAATGRDVAMTIVNGKIVYDRERDYAKWKERCQYISSELNKFIEKFIK